MYSRFAKPLLDLIIAATALLILSPIIIILFALVYIIQGMPVLFCQERPGKNARIFKLYKFRTMTLEQDAQGDQLPDEKRITRFGKFLRKTSLDELPQLINVLKGDVSLVGPRPLLVEYLNLYDEEQKKRHNVKPGITGWAQINGRNTVSWEEKFKLDLYYVNNISFLLDLKIILRTFKLAIRGSGIYNRDGAPMEKFTGSKK